MLPGLLIDDFPERAAPTWGEVQQPAAVAVQQAQGRSFGQVDGLELVGVVREVQAGCQDADHAAVLCGQGVGEGQNRQSADASDLKLARGEFPRTQRTSHMFEIGEVAPGKGQGGGQRIAVEVHQGEVGDEGVVRGESLEQGRNIVDRGLLHHGQETDDPEQMLRLPGEDGLLAGNGVG